jgi:hypothetical protein
MKIGYKKNRSLRLNLIVNMKTSNFLKQLIQMHLGTNTVMKTIKTKVASTGKTVFLIPTVA